MIKNNINLNYASFSMELIRNYFPLFNLPKKLRYCKSFLKSVYIKIDLRLSKIYYISKIIW